MLIRKKYLLYVYILNEMFFVCFTNYDYSVKLFYFFPGKPGRIEGENTKPGTHHQFTKSATTQG